LVSGLTPAIALLGLFWSTPACCCGGGSGAPYPALGPPGTISGSIAQVAGAGGPLTVYAIDSRDRRYSLHFVLTRVPAGQSTYEISVAPGFYRIVARLDADPASAAGDLLTIQCPTPGFEPDCGQPTLKAVRVDSQKPTLGADIADWGNPYAMYVLRNLDLYGVAIDASPPSVPAFQQRFIPQTPAPALDQQIDTGLGVRLALPGSWSSVQVPIIDRTVSENGAERYFANENVRSPLALDSNGVWLSVIWDDTAPCSFPSPRFISAGAQVARPESTGWFYFGEPDGPTQVQPFKGYSVMGGFRLRGDACMDFVFETSTSAARDANLPLFAAIAMNAQHS
jgi:hypothetical protein